MLLFEFNINIALSKAVNPTSEAIPSTQLPRSLDEITQSAPLMGDFSFHRGKHSSVPSTNQYPGSASKVVLREDVRLPLPEERAPVEKGG